MRYNLSNLNGFYTQKQLLIVAAKAKAEPDAVFIVGPWPEREFTAAQWLEWFRDKLMEKITTKGAKQR